MYIPTKIEMRAVKQGDEKLTFKLASIFLKEGRMNLGTYFLRLAASKHYQPAQKKLAAAHEQLKNWGWLGKFKKHSAV